MASLRTKYFLIMLSVNSVLAACIYLLLSLSFERTFTQYLNQRELLIAERISADLEDFYRENNGWGPITSDPTVWEQMLRQQFRRRPGRVPGEEPPLRRELRGLGPAAMGGARRPMGPPAFYLLNQRREHIAGNMAAAGGASLQALRVNGTVVGYLGVPSNPAVRDYLDRDFAAAFGKNFLAVLGLALLLALLAAVPLSAVLVRRIHELAAQLRQLAQGNYRNGLAVRGGDELSELARNINELGSTLDSNLRARKQWAADISHELRTPVAVLQADLESLEDGVRPLDGQAVQRLKRHAERLKRLIGDLHELSLTDLGSMSYKKVAVDLNRLIVECAEDMGDQFEQAGLGFSVDTASAAAITMNADRDRLQQLVTNLLSNSLRYTDKPGEVQLSLHREDNSAVITISDSAPGVEPALLPQLTRPLFRVDSSRSRQSGGSGLGLSLCANIVAAHHGELQFENSPRGGLTARVKLPLDN